MESGSRTAKNLEKYWKSWTNINVLKTFILQVYLSEKSVLKGTFHKFNLGAIYSENNPF